MNYCLIVESCEEYDGKKYIDSHIFTAYEDSPAIQHAENWALCKLFEMPDGKMCRAIPVFLREHQNMRTVKDWPRPSKSTVAKEKMTPEKKLAKIQEALAEYAAEKEKLMDRLQQWQERQNTIHHVSYKDMSGTYPAIITKNIAEAAENFEKNIREIIS